MSNAREGAAAFFTELIDAVRYGDSWSGSVEKQAEAKRNFERQLGAIDEIQGRIAEVFETEKLDSDVAEPLAKAVNDFVSAATQQSRGKVREKQKRTLEGLSAEADSFKLKSVKSLESFLAVTPLPVLDEEIDLDFSGGSYASHANYKCAGQIEYEFLLNTANSVLFKSDIASSAAWKGLRIPVRVSKAWLKKEPVPDYEKLDNYALARARASKNHLSAKLTNQATMASASIVFSRSNTDSFITVEYEDRAGKIDATGEPSLNRHLDLASIKQAMERLLNAMMRLDGDKLKLVKLACADEDILATLNCYGFMQRVVGVYAQSDETARAIRGLDPRTTAGRLKLLGEKGKVISAALGLGAQPVKPKPATP